MIRLLRKMLALSLLLGGTAAAKSADDYFHGGAYKYIEGKIQEASVEVEEGLRLHPGDPRLSALAGQLRKMKDQQRGNSGQGDGKDQKKDQGKKPGDSEKQDPGKKNPDDKDGDKQGDKDKPQPPKPGEDEKDQDGKEGQGSPPPNRMSEEEAKRLLNSFADDEKKEQAERRRAVRRRAGTEQDW